MSTWHSPATAEWRRLADGFWGREPARLSGPLPDRAGIDLRRCFATMATAAEPFRSGLRMRAVPNVRFFTEAGRVPGPGDLLPGPEDHDLTAYADRLRDDGRLRTDDGSASWLLTVDDPLVIDVALWLAFRDFLDGLWRLVGHPVLPVSVQFALGHGYTRRDRVALPPEAAGLMWVLHGNCEIRLWREGARTDPDPERPNLVLHGRTGDLLTWPADFRVAEVFADECLVVKLSVYGAGRSALANVKNLLAVLIEESPDYVEQNVPYLPSPAPADPDGSVPVVERIDQIGSLLHQVTRGGHLRQRLGGQWARLRSASGLEPVPQPLPDSTLEHDDRIRVVSEIFRLPEEGERALWAVNGNLLPVAGAAAERIRDVLPRGLEIGISELCRAVGAGERNQAVLSLLRKLHRLHAVQPVPRDQGPGEPGPTTSATRARESSDE